MIGAKSINVMLKNARNTGKINLTDRDLSVIPKEVFHVDESIFDDQKWWELRPLEQLDISHNKIQSIPQELSNLKDLKVIYAMNNQIVEFKEGCMDGLEQVVIIGLDHNQLREIPLEICGLGILQQLSISNNHISHFPNTFHWNCMQKLDLHGNKMESIPEELCLMKKLTHLNLAKNKISSIPNAIGSLLQLVELNVSENYIQELPSLAKLSYLQMVDARQNRISSVHQVFSNNQNLGKIFLGFNKLKSFPDVFSVTNLAELDVQSNQIDEIPFEITKLCNLKRLLLMNNNLNELLPELGTMKSLTVIQIQGNPLRKIKRSMIGAGTIELKDYLKKLILTTKVDSEIQKEDAIDYCVNEARYTGNLTLVKKNISSLPLILFEKLNNLTHLNVSGNLIKELPDDLFNKYSMIQVLNVSKNKIRTIPMQIQSLAHLVEFDCSRNLISSLPTLPESIQVLKIGNNAINPENSLPPNFQFFQLRELYYEFNKLRHFPMQIFQLSKSLEVLDLSSNLLSVIPPELVSMTKLQHLNVSNNNIKVVNPQIGKMEWLKSLQLQGNPLKSIRYNIINQGVTTILQHLRNQIVTSSTVNENIQNAQPNEEYLEYEQDPEVIQLTRQLQTASQVHAYAIQKKLKLIKAKYIRRKRLNNS